MPLPLIPTKYREWQSWGQILHSTEATSGGGYSHPEQHQDVNYGNIPETSNPNIVSKMSASQVKRTMFTQCPLLMKQQAIMCTWACKFTGVCTLYYLEDTGDNQVNTNTLQSTSKYLSVTLYQLMSLLVWFPVNIYHSPSSFIQKLE